MAEIAVGRIERLARRLRVTVWAVILVAAGLYLAARLGVKLGQVHVVARSSAEAFGPQLALARDLGALLTIAALWRLTAMLARIERGERFSPPVTRHFREFALLLLLAAVVTLLAPFVAMLVLPRDPHRLAIPISFRDVWMMIVTFVLFLVARLLDEAQRIESDLSEIV